MSWPVKASFHEQVEETIIGHPSASQDVKTRIASPESSLPKKWRPAGSDCRRTFLLESGYIGLVFL